MGPYRTENSAPGLGLQPWATGWNQVRLDDARFSRRSTDPGLFSPVLIGISCPGRSAAAANSGCDWLNSNAPRISRQHTGPGMGYSGSRGAWRRIAESSPSGHVSMRAAGRLPGGSRHSHHLVIQGICTRRLTCGGSAHRSGARRKWRRRCVKMRSQALSNSRCTPHDGYSVAFRSLNFERSATRLTTARNAALGTSASPATGVPRLDRAAPDQSWRTGGSRVLKRSTFNVSG